MRTSRPPLGSGPPAALFALLRASHLLGLALGSAFGRLRESGATAARLFDRAEENALLLRMTREAAGIFRVSWDKVAERRRPHYAPEERFRILRIWSFLGLSQRDTAPMFRVSIETIARREMETTRPDGEAPRDLWNVALSQSRWQELHGPPTQVCQKCASGAATMRGFCDKCFSAGVASVRAGVRLQRFMRRRSGTERPAPVKPPWPALTFAAALVFVPAVASAGPPYSTDDPEPVAYLHWEFYLATQYALTSSGLSGTAPHLEVNFGAAPNLQLHLIAPLAYSRPSGGPTAYGPGDVELGAKLRLVEESESTPMVGIFPLLELPTGSEPRGLGAGTLRAFIPLWLQKSFGPWMTYGGGGYWINAGAGNQNYWYVGWQAQRQVPKLATVGGEVFYTTADRVAGDSNLAFNVGLVLDLTEHDHVLLSAGRSIAGDTRFQGYLSYQLTF